MPDKERPTTRLQRLLRDPKLLLVPGGFSPMAARMVEAAGLEAFFLAGSQLTAFVYGLPDIGLIAGEEMTSAIQRMTAVSNVCVFADCDTGYGNALNAYHATQGFIRAGAAGMHLEDQVAPKRSGTTTGRQCIPVEEAVGKYRAAVAAKQDLDPDFVVCARCDLIGAEGGSFEEAVDRCVAYVEQGGVDLIWLNNIQTMAGLEIARRRIPGPLMPTFSGPPPSPTLQQLEDMGYSAAIFPGMTSGQGVQYVWDLLNDLHERGQAALDDRRVPSTPGKWGQARFNSFVALGPDQVKQIEAEFLTPDAQRNYSATFGHFAPPSN